MQQDFESAEDEVRDLMPGALAFFQVTQLRRLSFKQACLRGRVSG
jgi:hypothetical protein